MLAVDLRVFDDVYSAIVVDAAAIQVPVLAVCEGFADTSWQRPRGHAALADVGTKLSPKAALGELIRAQRQGHDVQA